MGRRLSVMGIRSTPIFELRSCLLTALEMAEAQASDFAKRHGMLVFHAVAEPEALITAQFVDQKS
jgi:hypothetical protein